MPSIAHFTTGLPASRPMVLVQGGPHSALAASPLPLPDPATHLPTYASCLIVPWQLVRSKLCLAGPVAPVERCKRCAASACTLVLRVW